MRDKCGRKLSLKLAFALTNQAFSPAQRILTTITIRIMQHKPSSLFTPYRLRNTTFPNRLVLAPMMQYRATDGFVSDWHIVHLGKFALGGFGAVMTEVVAVEKLFNIVEKLFNILHNTFLLFFFHEVEDLI
jgi:hypothetical protein